MVAQLVRIQRHTKDELPPPVRLRLRFQATVSGETVLERARQVMRLVAVAQDQQWPSDEDWRRALPEWFLRSFDGHDAQELLAHPELWDFGSWLDAMKNPGWEWWSCHSDDRGGSVRAVAYAEPFSIEPLEYLLRASGASDVDFEQE